MADSNSPALAKILVKKEIFCCLIPISNYENFSCIVGSLHLQQEWHGDIYERFILPQPQVFARFVVCVDLLLSDLLCFVHYDW